MSSMLNLSASKKSDSINVDVKPVTNVHIAGVGPVARSCESLPVRTREIEEGVTVVYPDNQSSNPYANIDEKPSSDTIDELTEPNDL